MQQSFKDMATRLVNAENSFIETIMNIAKCSESDAVKVFNAYIKAKFIKFDSANSRYTVKHGAYFDLDIIQNAIKSK